MPMVAQLLNARTGIRIQAIWRYTSRPLNCSTPCTAYCVHLGQKVQIHVVV